MIVVVSDSVLRIVVVVQNVSVSAGRVDSTVETVMEVLIEVTGAGVNKVMGVVVEVIAGA